jgi:hypothetical protein
LAWNPPGNGAALNYDIYRCAGTGCTPTSFKTGWVPASKAAPTFTDTVDDFLHSGANCPAGKTCYNTTYTYQVLANVVAVVEGVSTITASPLSNSASSKVTHLFVIADNQTVVYGGVNPAPTFKVYGEVSGTLAAGSVTCVYPGSVPRNAGSYSISCSGPATTSPTDGVTYNAAYTDGAGLHNQGTLTINKRPIAVTAAASTKVYDGKTTSTAVPTITFGSLAYSDTATFTESYDNPNVGANHVMTPADTITDGNGGNNYAVTFVTISTGVITAVAPLPLVITTTSLPVATAGQSYSALLAASGGTGLRTWSISSGTLPAGLSLDTAAGLISGTPAAGGFSSFAVRVNDSGSPAQIAFQSLEIHVYARVDLIVADLRQILRVSPDGSSSSVIASLFPACAYGVAIDTSGNFVVADPCPDSILKVTPGRGGGGSRGQHHHRG